MARLSLGLRGPGSLGSRAGRGVGPAGIAGVGSSLCSLCLDVLDIKQAVQLAAGGTACIAELRTQSCVQPSATELQPSRAGLCPEGFPSHTAAVLEVAELWADL